MKPLGPIASYQDDGYDPSQVFYVDLTDRLGTSETISDVTVTTSVTGITITEEAATTSEITKDDGDTIAVGQGVTFRITVTSIMSRHVPVVVSYETDSSNADTVEVKVQIVDMVR